jgi:hypothetical protein
MQKLFIPRGAGIIAVAVMALIYLAPVSAHHGWGGYLSEEFELSGTLETPVSTAGPHATTTVKSADGKCGMSCSRRAAAPSVPASRKA